MRTSGAWTNGFNTTVTAEDAKRLLHIRCLSSAPTANAAAQVVRATPVVPRVNAPTPPPAPAGDCNPPFYFDGKKKIFKPGCL